jgi:K+-sensing histidine kinase KdpD
MSLHVGPEPLAGDDRSAEQGATATAKPLIDHWVTPITVSLVLVGFTTLLLWAVQPALQQEHLIFIYFVPTTLIAIRYGSLSAMGVIIASSLAAAYFLYAPQFSFEVGNKLEVMELILFSLLALLASQVVSGFAKDSDIERRRPRAAPVVPHGRRLNAFLHRLRVRL